MRRRNIDRTVRDARYRCTTSRITTRSAARQTLYTRTGTTQHDPVTSDAGLRPAVQRQAARQCARASRQRNSEHGWPPHGSSSACGDATRPRPRGEGTRFRVSVRPPWSTVVLASRRPARAAVVVAVVAGSAAGPLCDKNPQKLFLRRVTLRPKAQKPPVGSCPSHPSLTLLKEG